MVQALLKNVASMLAITVLMLLVLRPAMVVQRVRVFPGVAPQADIMAVQVFSQFTGTECTDIGFSSPCVLAYTSDVIAGLDHVYSQRNSYTLASVNMSLGEGQFSNVCDAEPEKAAVDLLTAAGIAVVASSGNESYSAALAVPACISSVISVGATSDSDSVISFSNSASFLDFLAPGEER